MNKEEDKELQSWQNVALMVANNVDIAAVGVALVHEVVLVVGGSIVARGGPLEARRGKVCRMGPQMVRQVMMGRWMLRGVMMLGMMMMLMVLVGMWLRLERMWH
uniref:Uncharacterized protein n=1 Tax=Anopheles atroparvus TaxID=41427 RepID=A0A182IV33_ANOAO